MKLKTNSKAFYSFAKNISKTNEEIGPLINNNWEVTTDQNEMANILLSLYHKMFSNPVDEVPNIPTFPRIDQRKMDNYEINDEELKCVLKRLKGSPSPGLDGLLGYCYQNGENFIKDALKDCFNQSL